MKEYDLFVPAIRRHAAKLSKLKRSLSHFFGGLTYFPQHNEGLWRLGGVTFKDDIVILRVLAADTTRAEAFLKQVKTKIESDFEQEEVLIIARTVKLIKNREHFGLQRKIRRRSSWKMSSSENRMSAPGRRRRARLRSR